MTEYSHLILGDTKGYPSSDNFLTILCKTTMLKFENLRGLEGKLDSNCLSSICISLCPKKKEKEKNGFAHATSFESLVMLHHDGIDVFDEKFLPFCFFCTVTTYLPLGMLKCF